MTAAQLLLKTAKKKALDAIALLEASVQGLQPFSPDIQYSPKEREPFDALCDRFVRSIEICLKFFRTYEKTLSGESSETLRDLLNLMEKVHLISSAQLWIDMRLFRNRIVHDYLPEDLKKIYDFITTDFAKELFSLKEKIKLL